VRHAADDRQLRGDQRALGVHGRDELGDPLDEQGRTVVAGRLGAVAMRFEAGHDAVADPAAYGIYPGRAVRRPGAPVRDVARGIGR
jgi:hypothetical protein